MNAPLHHFRRFLRIRLSRFIEAWFDMRRSPLRVPLRRLVLLGIALSSASMVSAQGTGSSEPPGGFYHVERPYNVEHGFWQRHASTAQEGYLRGLSAYIQSLGVYDLNRAQADMIDEQVEWMEYQNRKERVQSFYDRRRIRADYVAEQRELAAQRDREGKHLLEVKQATEYRRAYKLSLQEYNPATGQIFWPVALQANRFAPHRSHIDQLFAHRTQYNLQGDEYVIREIERAQQTLRDVLQEVRHMIPPQDFLAAQTFLRGLLYEAVYPGPLNG